ncbi:hypothetical protein T11_15545 [Trichinella zimbabwensis]|uniref:Uncharacterized protein n=1 Tax=Trichinella zimbabwensis TaxID=268475 RepID=A0A0V1DQ51_9BILA|nr:hypothetical protein T11_15545 [Trichinella zimbabwensis]
MNQFLDHSNCFCIISNAFSYLYQQEIDVNSCRS